MPIEAYQNFSTNDIKFIKEQVTSYINETSCEISKLAANTILSKILQTDELTQKAFTKLEKDLFKLARPITTTESIKFAKRCDFDEFRFVEIYRLGSLAAVSDWLDNNKAEQLYTRFGDGTRYYANLKYTNVDSSYECHSMCLPKRACPLVAAFDLLTHLHNENRFTSKKLVLEWSIGSTFMHELEAVVLNNKSIGSEVITRTASMLGIFVANQNPPDLIIDDGCWDSIYVDIIGKPRYSLNTQQSAFQHSSSKDTFTQSESTYADYDDIPRLDYFKDEALRIMSKYRKNGLKECLTKECLKLMKRWKALANETDDETGDETDDETDDDSC